jgi:hypothetical protein
MMPCPLTTSPCVWPSPFTIGDITLWNNNIPLDPTLPESYLLQHCTVATFQLDNNKTGARNATIHHYSTGSPICPIAAIVCRLSHIYIRNLNNAVMGFWTMQRGLIRHFLLIIHIN